MSTAPVAVGVGVVFLLVLARWELRRRRSRAADNELWRRFVHAMRSQEQRGVDSR